MSDVKATSNSP